MDERSRRTPICHCRDPRTFGPYDGYFSSYAGLAMLEAPLDD